MAGFPLIRVGLLNSYEAHPQCNLAWPWSDSGPRSVTTADSHCLTALGITVSSHVSCGGGVVLRQCTILSAQRLSGPVDCDKGTQSGVRPFALAVNGVFWDAHFTHEPALAERAQWFIKDRAVCHRHLLSDGHTKAWILGLTACFTADLEDLNVTVNYGGHEQASTVKLIHITQVTVNVPLAFPETLLLGYGLF